MNVKILAFLKTAFHIECMHPLSGSYEPEMFNLFSGEWPNFRVDLYIDFPLPSCRAETKSVSKDTDAL